MEETNFWKALQELCKERGTSPTAVAKELGFSTGSPTGWKRGAVPSMTTIGKIALYFGVGMERFYGLPDPGSQEETKKAPAGEPAEAEDALIRFALFGDAPVSDEDYENVKLFAQMLAEKARKRNE